MILSHKTRSALRYKFVCNGCHIRFACEEDLLSHNCLIHADAHNLDFVCRCCGVVFEFKEVLKRHENKCNKSGTNSIKNINKLRGTPKYVCKSCGDMFKSEKSLKRHLDSNNGRKCVVRCEVCGIPCSSYSYLRMHQMTHPKRDGSSQRIHNKVNAMINVDGKSKVGLSHESLRQNKKKILKALDQSNKGIKKSKLSFKPIIIRPLPKAPSSTPSQENNDKPHRCSICGCCFKYDFSLYAHFLSHRPLELQAAEKFAEVVRCHEDEDEDVDGNEVEAIDIAASNQALINLLCGSIEIDKKMVDGRGPFKYDHGGSFGGDGGSFGDGSGFFGEDDSGKKVNDVGGLLYAVMIKKEEIGEM